MGWTYNQKPPLGWPLDWSNPINRDLIACYLNQEGATGGGTLIDSTPRGHHGTLTGGVTSVPKRDGPALDLDGTDGYIAVPDHPDFTPAANPFSISANIYMHNATSFVIATKGDYNVDGEWWFEVDSGKKLRFILFDESVASCFIGRKYDTIATAYQNQWIHLVETYDGGGVSAGVKLYLNGLRVDDIDEESNAGSFVAVENLSGEMRIGRRTTSYSDGLMNDVMLWRREVSPTEIELLYRYPYYGFMSPDDM